METTEESVIGMIQSGEDARKPREWGMMPNGMQQENRGYENGGDDMGRIAAGTRDSATAITCGQITAGDREVTVMEWT